MTISQRNAGVWGDGFVEDGWSEMAAVNDWAALSPDEYVRFFPALVPRDGRIPKCLERYLEVMIARQAGGLRDSGDRLGIDLDIQVSEKKRAEEYAGFRVLSDVLDMARSGALAGVDLTAATSFGYFACVHPAYLWPAAALSHERETTAAWLGVIAQGRAALMPIEVAEYLLDVIQLRDGRATTARDGQIAGLIERTVALEDVWQAARRRSCGHSVIVRRRRDVAQVEVRRLMRDGLARLKNAYSSAFSAGARVP